MNDRLKLLTENERDVIKCNGLVIIVLLHYTIGIIIIFLFTF